LALKLAKIKKYESRFYSAEETEEVNMADVTLSLSLRFQVLMLISYRAMGIYSPP
jgi:hypothetical protein